jgi:hypothetical protein
MNTSNVINTFDIPVSAGYIDNWGITEALREIKANAEDKTGVDGNYGWSYDAVTETLEIWNESAEPLTPATLVLGNSTKSNEDDAIGQFGEGYKLALIVLLREQMRVTIINHGKIWNPSFQESKTFGTETLHIEERWGDGHTDSIRFVIEGVTQENMDEFEQILLQTHMDVLEQVLESKGEYTVYRLNKELQADLDEATKTSKALDEMGDATENIAFMRTACNQKITMLRKIKNKALGTYVGGIYVEDSGSQMIIDYHPSKVTLSRDRDSFNNLKISKRAIIAQAFAKDWKSFDYRDIGQIEDMSFITEMPDNEKHELREEILGILGINPLLRNIQVVRSEDILREAKRLGIVLPEDAMYIGHSYIRVLKALDIVVENFSHPVLTKSTGDVVKNIIAVHMPYLMKDGNEKLLKDMNIISTLVESPYRSY